MLSVFSVSPPNYNQGLFLEVCVFGCSVSPPNYNQGLFPEVCVFGCSVSPTNYNQGLFPEVCVFGCNVSPPNYNQGLFPEVCLWLFGRRTWRAVVCTAATEEASLTLVLCSTATQGGYYCQLDQEFDCKPKIANYFN